MCQGYDWQGCGWQGCSGRGDCKNPISQANMLSSSWETTALRRLKRGEDKGRERLEEERRLGETRGGREGGIEVVDEGKGEEGR